MASSFGSPLLGIVDMVATARREIAKGQSLLDAIAGSSRFILAGHDRGDRVAHRLVLDHPDAVSHWILLNIVSTAQTYARADKALATSPTRVLNPALMSNRRPVAYVDHAVAARDCPTARDY